jgi:hypothetical protein
VASKAKPITLRDQVYVQERMDGKSKAAASKAACLAVGEGFSGPITETEDIKALFRQQMRQVCSQVLISSVIVDAMRATVVKTATQDGKITDVRAFKDHRTRLQAAQVAAEMCGYFEPKYEEAEKDVLGELLKEFRSVHLRDEEVSDEQLKKLRAVELKDDDT